MIWYGWAGLLLLAICEFFLFRRIEPFYSWFYSLAWWSYILVADAVLFRMRGRSLLMNRRRELAAMLPLSVFIWLLFEAYNLVIRNWAYEGIPRQIWLRWPGYAFAFATVLPGIFITSDLIETLVFRRKDGPTASESEALERMPATRPAGLIVSLGILLSVAPLVWPRVFFPAVWVGPVLLLNPFLEKLGLRGLSLSAGRGDRRRLISLLSGGLACGIAWEFWNFWAGSRWIYTVPHFGQWKAFEMPILGYLGFPPFALECWILYHLFVGLSRRLGSAAALMWAAMAAISLLIFHQIDRHTVVRFAADFFRS